LTRLARRGPIYLMVFTFIHTADWQLGKRFGQFTPEVSSALRLARQDVIERIADAAREKGAEHILVAGDVWDSAIPSNATLHQPLAIMGEAPDMHWWLLPGNHDPDGQDGLWDRVEAARPENVHLLREAIPVEISPEVFILPAPWSRIQHGQDLTIWMDRAETPTGAFRIGLAHGSVRGFGTEGDLDREVISPDRVERGNLDYLALGDWHARRQISPHIHYPGTPEPDRHKAGDRGQILAVTLELDTVPNVEVIPTAKYDWPVLTLDLSGEGLAQKLEEVRGQLESGHPLRRTHARLDVTGEVTVSEMAEFEAFRDALFGECASLDIRGESALRLIVVPEDIDGLDAQGSVRQAAEALVAKSTDSDLSIKDRQVAEDALLMLFRYAAETA